ncbi:hypothetical protein D1872_38620 [compost metagenome]
MINLVTEPIHTIKSLLIMVNKNLRVRVNVRILKEKEGKFEPIFSTYYNSNNGQTSMSIDATAHLIMEIMDDQPWDLSKWLRIDQHNIFQIIEGLKTMIAYCRQDTEPIFSQNENGEWITYADLVSKYTVLIVNLKYNQRLLLQPTIGYDENEKSYPAINIHVNNTTNYSTVNMDQLQSLYYSLTKVDLFMYAQQAVNQYIAMQSKIEVREYKREGTTNRRGQDHPLLHKEDVGITTQKGFINNDDKAFFGF